MRSKFALARGGGQASKCCFDLIACLEVGGPFSTKMYRTRPRASPRPAPGRVPRGMAARSGGRSRMRVPATGTGSKTSGGAGHTGSETPGGTPKCEEPKNTEAPGVFEPGRVSIRHRRTVAAVPTGLGITYDIWEFWSRVSPPDHLDRVRTKSVYRVESEHVGKRKVGWL